MKMLGLGWPLTCVLGSNGTSLATLVTWSCLGTVLAWRIKTRIAVTRWFTGALAMPLSRASKGSRVTMGMRRWGDEEAERSIWYCPPRYRALVSRGGGRSLGKSVVLQSQSHQSAFTRRRPLEKWSQAHLLSRPSFCMACSFWNFSWLLHYSCPLAASVFRRNSVRMWWWGNLSCHHALEAMENHPPFCLQSGVSRFLSSSN